MLANIMKIVNIIDLQQLKVSLMYCMKKQWGTQAFGFFTLSCDGYRIDYLLLQFSHVTRNHQFFVACTGIYVLLMNSESLGNSLGSAVEFGGDHTNLRVCWPSAGATGAMRLSS